MLNEAGYQEKFECISPWLEEIIDAVKKDLKAEHLKIDRGFCKKYFLGKNPNTVSLKELAAAYQADISAGNAGLGEFIATRWLLKNTDIYEYFAQSLQSISEDFDQLDALPEDLSFKLKEESVKQFGAKKTYLFTILNSVLFPPDILSELRKTAELDTHSKNEELQQQLILESIEKLQLRHKREYAALQDRYEKKLKGLERKYIQDTTSLKKQLNALQKKLAEHEG